MSDDDAPHVTCASSHSSNKKHCECGIRDAINNGVSTAEAMRVYRYQGQLDP